MRTTVEFSEDTAKAVEATRRELGVGVSEAVNELIRCGQVPRPDEPRFKQRTRRLGIQVVVSNIASTLARRGSSSKTGSTFPRPGFQNRA